ncbi:hypothetical protein EGR_07993 [Echinococcus granulosus]|uniref:DUF5727 domain-containing protein n=1 Tax=Echinococcus granulosus TaxID=6210 RepID=W6U9I6_ECHGR|nr:hypothetical protein EGR_07993 [Echinococcus granulosus]EUB57176.1 hypothetical protein EGR_07993 [Echinococcus granulosus]
MLKIIAVVLCVPYCTVVLHQFLHSFVNVLLIWGRSNKTYFSLRRTQSRAVGLSGRWNAIRTIEHDEFFVPRPTVRVSNKESVGNLTIEDGHCMVNGTIWGSPCTEGNNTANITVKDVSLQNRLDIFTDWEFHTPVSTTVFAPYCNFPKPDKDEVDVQTSFPLSHFVKGQESFELAFAIGGADSNGTTHFGVNGERACEWRGHKLVQNITDLCTDMEINRTSDLRVFRITLPTTSDEPYASFGWGHYNSFLTVTVDFTQNGPALVHTITVVLESMLVVTLLAM